MKDIKDTEKAEEATKTIPREDIKKHPELSRAIEEPEKQKRRAYHFIPRQFIERLNKPLYTNLILGFSMILSLSYFMFGTLGALANLSNISAKLYSLFETTAILGWEQMKVTGFVLIIIGLIMCWSIPYYIRNKNQQADSYLVIGAGIGLIFGFIYILIILADVLAATISTITEGTQFHIETAFYIPIILAIFALPLFRILTIRHMVVLPDLAESKQSVSLEDRFENKQPEKEKIWRFEHHQYEKHRKFRYERREWGDARRKAWLEEWKDHREKHKKQKRKRKK